MSIVVCTDSYRGTKTQVFAVRGGGFGGKIIRLAHGYHSPVYAPTVAAVVAASRTVTDEIHDRVGQVLSAPLPFSEEVAPWLSGAPQIIVAPPPVIWNNVLTHVAKVTLANGGDYFVPLADQDPQLP